MDKEKRVFKKNSTFITGISQEGLSYGVIFDRVLSPEEKIKYYGHNNVCRLTDIPSDGIVIQYEDMAALKEHIDRLTQLHTQLEHKQHSETLLRDDDGVLTAVEQLVYDKESAYMAIPVDSKTTSIEVTEDKMEIHPFVGELINRYFKS